MRSVFFHDPEGDADDLESRWGIRVALEMLRKRSLPRWTSSSCARRSPAPPYLPVTARPIERLSGCKWPDPRCNTRSG
jgi:hypothetical protein